MWQNYSDTYHIFGLPGSENSFHISELYLHSSGSPVTSHQGCILYDVIILVERVFVQFYPELTFFEPAVDLLYSRQSGAGH